MTLPGASDALAIAVPKSERLLEPLAAYLGERGIEVAFSDRELVAASADGRLRFLLVKNEDVTTYVGHGIAGLGICGTDKRDESEHRFYTLGELPFGSGRMCLIRRKGEQVDLATLAGARVATRYPAAARAFFHARGIPVEIIKLNGSVELALVLGLAPLIVDLVETGRTLAAHDLEVVEQIGPTRVELIANPAFSKIRFREVGDLAEALLSVGAPSGADANGARPSVHRADHG